MRLNLNLAKSFDNKNDKKQSEVINYFEKWKRELDVFIEWRKNTYNGSTKAKELIKRDAKVLKDFINFCKLKKADMVLDIGCGGGDFNMYSEDIQYIGIDPLIVSNCPSFQFIQGIGEYLPFLDTVFDVVVTTDALDHTNNPSKVMEESYRVLRKNGKICILLSVTRTSIFYKIHRAVLGVPQMNINWNMFTHLQKKDLVQSRKNKIHWK